MNLNPSFWQYLLPQHLLSRLVGKLAFCRWPWLKNALIRRFVKRFGVDLSEAVHESPEDFEHFNAFFTRALKPTVRSIDSSPQAFISPVDGTLSAFGRTENQQLFQAKGHTYTLQALLGAKDRWFEQFKEALYATMYLAPRDYHRIHMPVSGTLIAMRYVPGKLFSVNQKTAETIPGLFAKNERVILFFETEFGPMALILVGAMIVASMSTVFAGVVAPGGNSMKHRDYVHTEEKHITLNKGEEVGHFLLGSTVITLLGCSQSAWDDALELNQPLKLGERIGRLGE